VAQTPQRLLSRGYQSDAAFTDPRQVLPDLTAADARHEPSPPSPRGGGRGRLRVAVSIGLSAVLLVLARAHPGALLPPRENGVIAAYYSSMGAEYWIGAILVLIAAVMLAVPYDRPIPVLFRVGHVGTLVLGGLFLAVWVNPQYPALIVARDQIVCGYHKAGWREIGEIAPLSRRSCYSKSGRWCVELHLKDEPRRSFACPISKLTLANGEELGEAAIYRQIVATWQQGR
jgi:hypothetical protein